MRQHAVATLNLTQKAKEVALGGTDGDGDKSPNTAFIEGVRKFAMDVRELDIDLIDRINPFGEAYAILAKTMSEESLKQVAAVIGAKCATLTIEKARELAKRALKFKQERGRLPSTSSARSEGTRLPDALPSRQSNKPDSPPCSKRWHQRRNVRSLTLSNSAASIWLNSLDS